MNTQQPPVQTGHATSGMGLFAAVSPEKSLSLSDLALGQNAQVRDISARGELGRRLRDMGLLPGVMVAVSARAPLGDPIAVELDGCTLSLRCAEAAQVLVSDVQVAC